jgi:acyl-CoA thioesterase FadM
MEDFGIPFQAWLDRGLYIVVTRIDMRIHAPAFMGDELEIRVTPVELRLVKGTFHQEIVNTTRGNKTVTATVYGAIVDRQGKPVRIPEEFRKAFLAE